VLGRSWIDQRDTWMHPLIKELERTATAVSGRPETIIRSDLNSRMTRKAYDDDSDDEEGEKKPKRYDFNETINVDNLRKLFEKFTPFPPSGPTPIENRQLLYPLRETADELQSILEKDTRNYDSNNVSIFTHDFFNDSMSFLGDPSVRERLKGMVKELPGFKERIWKRNTFEKRFPCARWNVQTGHVLSDYGFDHYYRIMNMLDNEEAFEISTNLAWLLDLCKGRLQEDMRVLFRAVQRIEMSLNADFLASAKPRLLSTLNWS